MPLQQQVDTTSTGLTVLREFQPDQKNVDHILCGGIETRAVTEFYGAPKFRKMQSVIPYVR